VGKSTLIGMMTRKHVGPMWWWSAWWVSAAGEVGEFLTDALGEEGPAVGAVVIVSDIRPIAPAAYFAQALAANQRCGKDFAAEGKDVLLVLDSLTRFAMAAR